jgi:acyl-[acyl-carrier-protein] desaturase
VGDDPVLQRLVTAAVLQGDESRHEAAYQKIFQEVVSRDPDTAVLAFADIMQKSVVMPAHLMHDGGEGVDAVLAEDSRRYHQAKAEGASVTYRSNFFNNFSSLADNMGVYTAQDYADCVKHLLKRWKISELSVRPCLKHVALVS